MDGHDDDDKVQHVRGVNWAPNSTDEEDEDPMTESEEQYVRGVNWAPNSTDEDEDPMDESEVRFIWADSRMIAGNGDDLVVILTRPNRGN
jgi:hypothetical protein